MVSALPLGLPMLSDEATCPHMAALLRSREELPAVLASFYNLGASRNGWLWFGSLPSASDRDRLMLAEAGLDVARLESTGQLVVTELDLSVDPEAFVDPWVQRLDEALAGRYDALWFARFPIEPGAGAVAGVIPFERAWMDRFRDRRCVTLCPYIVDGLDTRELATRADAVGAVHDLVIELVGGALRAR